jgi:hypothetical protein
MKYPNALSGIRTIRTATILSVWLLVVTFLVFLAALGTKSGGLGLLLFLGIVTLALGVTVLIMELSGVSRAAKDMAVFGTARTALIIGLIVSVVSFFFDDNSAMETVLDTVSSVCSLVATVYILKGIIALAENCQRGDLVDEGQKLIKLILAVAIFGLVVKVINAVLPTSAGTLLLLILLAVAILVLGLAQLILFLGYLKKAIAMLETGDTTYGGTGGTSGSSKWGYDM